MERMNFVFDLFDTKCTGTYLTKLNLLLLFETILSLKKKRRQFTPTTIKDNNNNEDSKKENKKEEEDDRMWKKEAEQMLLPTSTTTTISREIFCSWASINLDTSLLLDVFRVFPTKEGQLVRTNIFCLFFFSH